ncbi:hypothetical protein [Exiguobacterium sp. s191]|uniref:hypothetical protein n=1 Tax=Exiguobacterium sp. s191 TaxID=2751196 RepID=UPI001BEB7405|nr:hypothetical protein [Exiguobacterium sp. s191]
MSKLFYLKKVNQIHEKDRRNSITSTSRIKTNISKHQQTIIPMYTDEIIRLFSLQNITFQEDIKAIDITEISKKARAKSKSIEDHQKSLNVIYNNLDKKIWDFLKHIPMTDDIEDDLEIYLFQSEAFENMSGKPSENDIKKEISFLEKNLEFFGEIDNEDKVIMLISLLMTSKKRLKTKTVKRSLSHRINLPLI